MPYDLRDVTGFRGEHAVVLCLTDYSMFTRPLFHPGFLGEKWPVLDFYVELAAANNDRLFFFAQVKSTAAPLKVSARSLAISTTRRDIDALRDVPAPTYILGVHEPSQRVFVRSVHSKTPSKSISSIPLAFELTPPNLRRLFDEVATHWATATKKPKGSLFG